MPAQPSRAAALSEALLVAIAGAGLGVALALPFSTPLAATAGASAGLGGALAGYRGIYAWRRPAGWLAFAADSTWGLLGTTLGNLVHLADIALPRSGYRADLSRRRNRHVFERGVRFRHNFALAHGNVISNAATGRERLADERRSFIDRHEELHVWQSRLFGPLYQAVYVVWSVGGALVAASTWVLRRGHPQLRRLVETAAYYDNPFEYWAYRRDRHWEDNPADPVLKWRRPRWLGTRSGRPGDGPRAA